VGYWSFNEGVGTVATDFSGNGNTGALVSGPPWVNGKRSKAVDLFAADYITMGDVNAADGLTRITVSAWVKSRAAGSNSSEAHVVDKSNCTGGGGDGPFELWTPGTFAEFTVYTAGAGNSSGMSTTNIDDGQWHFWTGTYDGTNVAIWIDGVQENLLNIGSVTLTDTGNILNVGGFCNGSFSTWLGTVDEVRIYNRALGQSEIARLYQSGAVKLGASSVDLQAGSSLEKGLVGHWTFDGPDITASAILDRSGQGNNAGFHGGSTSTAKVIGKLGQAMNFNGTSNYGATSRVVQDDFTLSAWVKKGASLTNNDDCSIDMWYCGFGVVDADVDGAADDFGLAIKGDKAIFGTGNPDTSVLSTAPLNNTDWYHLVATRVRSTGAITLYVNGAQVDTDTAGTQSLTAPTTVYFGAIKPLVYQTFFNGKIDDVRVYNRALGATEIRQLYNLGRVVIQQQ
jgi:hypothetical protein